MEKVLGNIILDQEWIALMKEAKEIGLTLEEIRAFFHIERKK
ncbi:anti-repressor SinI family protein [Oceanobacillus bengalensis]|nr:anti-repressor SinI family protein [Oceanobacillus bengalensis]